MYSTCPKCGHRRAPEEPTPADRCPACGLLFDKWLRQRFRAAKGPQEPPPAKRAGLGRIAEGLLAPAGDGRIAWTLRLGLWAVLIWTTLLTLASGYEDAVAGSLPGALRFLHRVDLVFHEAGHVLFRPFGEFMTILGGSLLQVLVPAAVAAAFLVRHGDNFGASVGLWWTGQSLTDVAVYIRDARELRLPLLGGGTGADRPGLHDWENLLSWMGLLRQERLIAAATDLAGLALMALALAWAAALLWRRYRDLG